MLLIILMGGCLVMVGIRIDGLICVFLVLLIWMWCFWIDWFGWGVWMVMLVGVIV